MAKGSEMTKLMASIGLSIGVAVLTVGGALAQNQYENKTLGVSVVKPDSWVFMTDAQNRDNLSRTQMADSDFQKLVVERSRAPIFVIAKYPEPHDDLNPSVKISVRPAGILTEDGLVAALTAILQFVVSKVADDSVIGKVEKTEIDGFPAAVGEVMYTLGTQEGAAFPTKSRMWMVLKGELLFIIGVGMHQSATPEVESEVQSVIDSIDFT